MKRIFAIYVILSLAACAGFAETSENDKWKAELQRLNKQISELKKTVELQKIEINRLKALCQENSIDISPKEKSEKPTQEAISKPMFGIFLGESLTSLRKRCRISRSTVSFDDKDYPGEIWDVPNDNANIKQLSVYMFEEKVYAIHVEFTDASKDNYEAIKSQLEKKYKTKDEGGLTGALFGEGDFKTIIDDAEIRIKLNRDIGFMKGDKLELSYVHIPLNLEVGKEIMRRKTRKIGSDL